MSDQKHTPAAKPCYDCISGYSDVKERQFVAPCLIHSLAPEMLEELKHLLSSLESEYSPRVVDTNWPKLRPLLTKLDRKGE